MFLTTATGRCSIAPADARTTAGVTRAALWAGTTTPVAPAPSPRVPAPPGAHATPRGRAGGRRSARGSFGDELKAVGDISDLPALVLDLAAQAVRLVEVTARPRLLPLLRERDQAGRRLNRFGEVA